EGEHVAGHLDVVRPRVGSADGLDGGGSVVGAGPGGRGSPGVDRHGEGGLERAFLPCPHERDPEPLQSATLARHADDAPAVGGHEVDGLGGDLLGGQDEVALVLPVRVVDDDHHPARPDLLDGLRDRRKALFAPHADLSFSGHDVRARPSRYFATTSASMLTGSPCSTAPRVVTSRVYGTSATPNASPFTPATVRLTPSTATE